MSHLPEIFDKIAAIHPDRIALDIPPGRGRTSRNTVTYSKLQSMSLAIGHAIKESATVAPDSIVAILLPRDTESLYAAQLGVLNLGAAFTCLDPLFPDEHIRSVLIDADAVVILTDCVGRERLAANNIAGSRIVIDVSTIPNATSRNIAASNIDPNSLAYVIYTSGTTGKPKGVMIEHRSIANLVESDVTRFGLGPNDRVAQCSSPAYDSSLEETWLAFAVGATLVLLDDETVRLGPDLVPWLNHERITVFCPPPTLLRTTGCEDPARALPLLKLIYVGGEALPQDLADLWSQDRRLENGYGPTECTVTVVRTRIYSGVAVTIGRPVEGHTVRIVDEALCEVAIGCEGELCISGIGLARGYRNRPEITAEKFIVHPKFGRIYRTGDLTRLTPSGDIEYLGRIDGQIKLRGYRVELAAIDALLGQCEGVREAACRVQGEGASQIIVGHIVAISPSQKPNHDALRAVLTQTLPAYMVPARFASIDCVPRTVAGKIDRARLPEINQQEDRIRPLQSPRSANERGICNAFARAVNLTGEISIDDDFFMALGGDSLSAVSAICELRKNPATERLSVRDIYEHRTPERLAQRLALTDGLPEVTHSPRMRAGIRADDPTFASIVQALALIVLAIATGAISYSMFFGIIPSSFENLGFGLSIAIAPFVTCVAILLFGLLAITLTVFAKRILLSKVRPITTPVFSATYLRHWIVQQFARLIPWGLIEGTVFYNSVLRLLGAKIGKRVHIHRGVELRRGGWDLLTIGDDVTLAQESTLTLIDLRDGQFILAPITIGDRCTVDVRAGLGQYAEMQSDSSLAPLSWLDNGACIPQGEKWDGVPAIKVAMNPPTISTTRGRSLNPNMHGILMVGARLALGIIATIPWIILAWLLHYEWNTVEPSIIAAIIVIASPLCVIGALIAQALSLRLLGRTNPGVINRWSVEYISIWAKSQAVESAGRWLSGTLFWPTWLRLAGMRIGKGCEISTIIDVVPDTVTIGETCFFADGIYFASPRVDRNSVFIGETSIGDNTFIGNHAVISAGFTYSPDYFVGVSTVADATVTHQETAWFGHPAMQLPRRDVVSADRTLTHEPNFIRYADRFFWEFLRFTLPIFPIGVGWCWWGAINESAKHFPATITALVIAPLAILAAAFIMITSIVILKWALLGRVRPGQHALWSCWCSRWDFLFVAWGFYARGTLERLDGTIFLNAFLRLIGVRIGKRVVLGHGFTQVVDPDMLSIGDDATVACNFQAHSFEDRILKIDSVRIEDRATVGHHAVLFYGSTIGKGALVTHHSVIMKNEEIESDAIYCGCPAVRLIASDVDLAG